MHFKEHRQSSSSEKQCSRGDWNVAFMLLCSFEEQSYLNTNDWNPFHWLVFFKIVLLVQKQFIDFILPH